MTTAAPREPLTPEQQALVTQARPLVEEIARRLRDQYNRFVSQSELIACGNIGLVEAAQVFDRDLGVKFTTFAAYRIEGAMLDSVRKTLTFQQGLHVSARVAAAEFLSAQRDTSDPLADTDEDCSRRLKAFSDGLLASMFTQVLQEARRADTEEALATRDAYGRAIRALDMATGDLSERDKKIIEMHYHQHHDLKEVARALGVSYATVRRYHGSLMERLATRLNAQGITEAPIIDGAP